MSLDSHVLWEESCFISVKLKTKGKREEDILSVLLRKYWTGSKSNPSKCTEHFWIHFDNLVYGEMDM